MRKSCDRPRGIQWTPFSHQEDLDLADDIAVLSTTAHHLQQKTDKLSSFANKVGLTIRSSKTKVMDVNSLDQPPVTVNEHVEESTYLGSVVSADNAAHNDILAQDQQSHKLLRETQASLKVETVRHQDKTATL